MLYSILLYLSYNIYACFGWLDIKMYYNVKVVITKHNNMYRYIKYIIFSIYRRY